MLDPDDYGARIAFVDYNRKTAIDNYKNAKPKTPSDEIEFVKQNAPRMLKSIDALRGWVDYIKRD